jgi:hypothetical protein
MLANQGAIGIIGGGHPSIELGLEPISQGHIQPTGQVDGHAGNATPAIAGARMANAHPGSQPIGI